MCGIAGYHGNGNKQLLSAMLESIKHRGPDDRGIEIFHNVGLGHNRLSIIDLSNAGHQPMPNEDKTIFVVFNGEIYNFQEIKIKLKYKHTFKSSTDSEVIVHAYEEYGIECLNMFNGMFSFVIYDIKKNLLFGARDRLGKKPLKYYIDQNIFAFASEIKALLFCLKNKPEIDFKAINDFLTLQYIPAPKTGFKNIFKLPPGHYFIFNGEKLIVNRYWKLEFTEKMHLPEDAWEKLILEKLENAVKKRMISDVPLGAFLSGGLDSSAVVALMAKNSHQKIKTFSVGFDDPKFDETYYAQLVAQKYKTDHTTLIVNSKTLLENIPRLIDFYDEPLADNSILPTFLLCQLARKHITVALNGDGGDENFAGYDRYNVVYFSQFYKHIPQIIRKNIIDNLVNTIYRVYPSKLTERVKKFSNTSEFSFYRKYVYYNCFFTNELKEGLCSREFKEEIKKSDTFDTFRSIYNPCVEDLDNALNFDINNYLPEDLLYKIDCASMSFALELRSPFLDYELVELTAKMPCNLKIHFFDKKHLFKKILVKNDIIPREVAYRKKMGFIIPLNKWFKGCLKEYVREQILSNKIKESNIFNYSKLEEYVDNYLAGKLNCDDNNMFALLFLSFWINKYI